MTALKQNESKRPAKQQIRPGPWSFLTNGWMTPVTAKARNHGLDEEDLYELADKDKTAAVEKYLDGYVSAIQHHLDNPSKPAPSLPSAIIGMVKGPLAGVLLFELLQTTAVLASPFVLGELTKFVQTGNANNLIVPSGLGLAFLLFSLQLLGSLCRSAVQSFSRRVTVVARASLTGVVFRKSLKLSIASKAKFTEGKIMTLMNDDLVNVVGAIPQLSLIITIPLQLIVTLVLLWTYLGISLFAAAGVLLFIVGAMTATSPFIQTFFAEAQVAGEKRIQTLREFLYGIKVIKIRVLEDYFHKKIHAARSKELRMIKRVILLVVGAQSLGLFGQTLATVAAFITFGMLGNRMDAQVIFPCIALFNQISTPLGGIGAAIQTLPMFLVSAKRVAEMLEASEYEGSAVSKKDTADRSLDEKESIKGDLLSLQSNNTVQLKDVTLTWCQAPTDEEQSAQDSPKTEEGSSIDKENQTHEEESLETKSEESRPFELGVPVLEIPRGSLTAVVGAVGSGKSTLLSGLIGEALLACGEMSINGSIAYCSQQPWILTGSIEKNILIGQEKDQTRLSEAVNKSGLKTDLEILEDGIKTEIGESGVNLSGGQKARVSLARAIYRNADIMLLDDPLAALDSHVGKEVFNKAIKGKPTSTTVILVTHQLQYLQQCDQVIVVDGGLIVEQGTFQELINVEGGALNKMMRGYSVEEQEKDKEDKSDNTEETAVEESDEDGKVFMDAEEREKGHIKSSVYSAYMKATGVLYPTVFVINSLMTLLLMVGTPLLLTRWVADESLPVNDPEKKGMIFFISLYAGSGVLFFFSGIFMIASGFFVTITASKIFHEAAVVGLLKAPLHFFQVNQVGRILNRLTADVQSMDLQIFTVFVNLLFGVMSVLSTIILVSQVSWYLLLAFFALGAVGSILFKLYQATNLPLKRMNSTARSPLDSHISETLTGLSTIRAYGLEETFLLLEAKFMDDYQAVNYMYASLSIWLDLRLGMGTSLITLAVGILASQSGNIGSAYFAAAIGLALVYISDFAQSVNMLVLNSADTEAEMNAVERLYHYGHRLAKEPAAELSHDSQLVDWPSQGKVEMENLLVAYPSNPDVPVIKGISVTFNPGEKVGIVGRTGSGKSTIALALFRLMDPTSGIIKVDGTDITKIGLKKLRSKLEMIPQEPVLFEGTYRSNLDNLGQLTDDQLWQALEYSGMKAYVSEQTDKLDAEITANGENLSVGQRQLVCLSQAILSNPRVLVMDEATASVDGESDKLIQKAIKEHFSQTTVISIAHRLNTIANFDRVLVLDAGKVVEFDHPHVLLSDSTSLFSELVEASGSGNAELVKELARNQYLETYGHK